MADAPKPTDAELALAVREIRVCITLLMNPRTDRKQIALRLDRTAQRLEQAAGIERAEEEGEP